MNNISVVFSNLLSELPPETVAVRYISRTYTAAEMEHEVRNETEAGKEYVSECLRVARDLIVRQAKR